MTPDEQRLADLQLLRERVDAEIRRLLLMKQRPPRRRRSRHERPDCGTEEGYQWHRWRKQSCDDCKRAHAQHTAREAAIRRLRKKFEAAA